MFASGTFQRVKDLHPASPINARETPREPFETPFPGTTDHARSVSEPQGTPTRIAAWSLCVRAKSIPILLARRALARRAPLVHPPACACLTLDARAFRLRGPACFPNRRLAGRAARRDSGVLSPPALVPVAHAPLSLQRASRMPGDPLLPEGETTPRETPLPEGVMVEIQRLREEHDRDASREKGKRAPRVRTDADRAKEKERSARRRREQTDAQREAERLRSLKRRRAMTPEQRKAASVKRVRRRQQERIAAAFPETPLVPGPLIPVPLIGSVPQQYTHAHESRDPRTPNAEGASAEDASFALPRAAAAAAAAEPDSSAALLDALRGADPDAAADPLGVLNAHPVDDALGHPAGGAEADQKEKEAERRRLEEERARSRARRARMSAEEKQFQHQARHARRQRAKGSVAAGLEDAPAADPARVEGTLEGDDE